MRILISWALAGKVGRWLKKSKKQSHRGGHLTRDSNLGQVYFKGVYSSLHLNTLNMKKPGMVQKTTIRMLRDSIL